MAKPLTSCKACGTEMSRKAPACPKCGHPNKEANYLSGGQVVWGLLVGVAVIWWMASRDSSESIPSAPDPHETAVSSLSLENIKWHTDGFGTVMMLDATVKNSGSRSVKDVKIECDSFGKSGTKVDTNTKVIYDTFPAKKTTNVKNFNMGFINSQAASSSCSVVDAALQ
jgi:hypothetical protein